MKITYVSQASVIIETESNVVWTDPWLDGTAFNDSWRLMPPSSLSDAQLESITDLWISHEHPDHFHIPTLKSLPKEFKERVTVWFQKNNSDKVVNALKAFGFKNVNRLFNRKWQKAGPSTELYCMGVGQMDSLLAVRDANGVTAINVNDCELDQRTRSLLKKDIKQIDVLMNQFSMAGYSGEADKAGLPAKAEQILESFHEDHTDLGAKVSMPIASQIYFCKPENFFMNEYANSPSDVAAFMAERNQEVVVLYPSDQWEVGTATESDIALEKYQATLADKSSWVVEPLNTMSLEDVEAAFHERANQLSKHYPKLLLKQLKPVRCRIPDLDKVVEFSVADKAFSVVDAEPEVAINSQPLFFLFKWPWGLQTLGVSARLVMFSGAKNWKKHRIIFALNNAEIYFKGTQLFSKKNMSWFKQRSAGAVSQLLSQLKRMD